MAHHGLIGSIRRYSENNCAGLREFEPPPLLYRKYLKLPDGKEIYVGEFPAPNPDDFRLGFNNSRRK